MKPDNQNGDENPKHDEDVKFERDKESAIIPLTDTKDSKTPGVGETIIPGKEETLGNGDFPALSELEKKPKLPEEDK